MTTTITVPTPIDLTDQRLVIGDDGNDFIAKITKTQAAFETFSSGLGVTVSDMQALAAEQEQGAVQVAQDKQTVTTAANQVAQDKQTITTAANQVAQDKQTVTTAANQVAQDKQTVTTAKNEAVAAVSALPDGTVNDSIIATNSVWSSSKTVMELTRAVDVSLIAPPTVVDVGVYVISASAISRHEGGSIVSFEISWWNGQAESVPAVGGSAVVSHPVDQPVGGSVSVSVVAVDDLGNRSISAEVSAIVSANQPPVGAITINHASTVQTAGSFDVSLTGATDADGEDSAIRYEIVDLGGLSFSKTADIAAGELISVTAPDVTTDTDYTFRVRAVDQHGSASAEYSSTVTVQAAKVIGVKLVATGGSGGTWSHIDAAGNEISAPTVSWFNSHPVWGGIVDQVIDGQHMVKIPKFYYKRGTAGGRPAWWVSDQPFTGFKVFPAFLLSGQVVDQFWYGKYQASTASRKLLSVPGNRPAVNMDLGEFINYAFARNVGGVEGFRLIHYDMLLAIQWLYLVEHATFDSQTKTAAGRVEDINVTYVDHFSVVSASYRGITGLWGNIYQWLDGVKTNSNYIWRRSYDGAWQNTGFSVVSSYDVSPITFKISASQFLPDTYQSSTVGATLPDNVSWYQGTDKIEGYPVVGGFHRSRDQGGLWFIECSWYGNTVRDDIGSRLARIV